MVENKESNKSIKEIRVLAGELSALYGEAERAYSPLVEVILERESEDEREIEFLLEQLLDFAGDERCLVLYRKLCRYYYSVNPLVAAKYVDLYRKLWDEEGRLFQSGYFRENPL